MRKLSILLAVVLAFIVGGCSPLPPADYVATHRRLYEAKKPYLSAYSAEHPDVAPAISDNLAAEDALIKSAEPK